MNTCILQLWTIYEMQKNYNEHHQTPRKKDGKLENLNS